MQTNTNEVIDNLVASKSKKESQFRILVTLIILVSIGIIVSAVAYISNSSRNTTSNEATTNQSNSTDNFGSDWQKRTYSYSSHPVYTLSQPKDWFMTSSPNGLNEGSMTIFGPFENINYRLTANAPIFDSPFPTDVDNWVAQDTNIKGVDFDRDSYSIRVVEGLTIDGIPQNRIYIFKKTTDGVKARVFSLRAEEASGNQENMNKMIVEFAETIDVSIF